MSDGRLVFATYEFDFDPEFDVNHLSEAKCTKVALMGYKDGYCINGIYPGMSLDQAKKILTNEGYTVHSQNNSTGNIAFKKDG